MKPSIHDKLQHLTERRAEIDALLGSAEATRDMENYRRLTREHAEIGPVVELFAAYGKAEADLAAARGMLDDPEMKELAAEEIEAAQAEMQRLEDELQRALLPRDPNDEKII